VNALVDPVLAERAACDLPAADALDRALRDASPAEVIATALRTVGRERLALVSSFGTESAALLKVMADVDPAIPVIFLDTGWLFEETLAYRDTLIATLGLRDVRSIQPLEQALSREDPDRELWFSDPDACCRIRKVEPLARALARESARRNAISAPRAKPIGDGALDTDQVMEILPHRFPFLMVDRILSFEGGTKVTGIKSVSINEPFFQGHFPGHPVMPGVLQVEAMAQVASVLLFKLAETSSRIGYFMSADGVKFRKPVFPGDTLYIYAELTKTRGNRLAKAKCHCVVNDAVVSEGELMFTFVDK